MYDLRIVSDEAENIKEFGMYQLAHNQFFVKDGCAWYRDFEREISCRDLIREIVRKNSETLVVDETFFTEDEFFNEEINDWLQYGTDDFYGVVAMYYNAMWGMADVREWYKESLDVLTVISENQDDVDDSGISISLIRDLVELGNYRKKDRAGEILKLPCKFGDKLTIKQDGVFEKVEVVDFAYHHTCGFCVVVVGENVDKKDVPFTEFGKSIFNFEADNKEKEV